MPARIEILIKLDELPTQTTKIMGNGQMFVVGEVPGPRFVVTLNKKSWKKLVTAAEQYPRWLAVISGKFGECVGEGIYRMENAGLLNVMERKPKGTSQEAEAPTEGDAPEGEGAPPPAATSPTPAATPAPAPPTPAPKAQPAPPPAQPEPAPIPKAWLKASKPHGKRKAQPAYLPKWRASKEQRLLAPPEPAPAQPVGPPAPRRTTKEIWIARRANPPEVVVRRPVGGGGPGSSSGSGSA